MSEKRRVRVQLDTEPLEKLAKLTKKYRYKRSIKWKPVPEKVARQIIHDYANYWINVIESAGIKFDSEKYLVNMPEFKVSSDIDKLVFEILPALSYLSYSPGVDKTLPPQTCEFDVEKIFVKKEK